MSKIAVVLSGCGYLDGAEINEAVAVLWALSYHSKNGVQIQCFAPDDDQYHVIDHLTGNPLPGERRNILQESARITRGKVRRLTDLSPAEFDALIMPGGFGAAKNLSSFALQGSGGEVHQGLAAIIRSFHDDQKPIGAACIAPAVVGLALKPTSLTLTVGEPGDAANELEKLGHKHQSCALNEIAIDPKNKIITTPAFMYDDAVLVDLFEGVKKMVDQVVEMVKTPQEVTA